MARTIIIDEIKKDEIATPVSIDGIARAWANVNGSGVISIRDSLNLSSIVDDGTGKTTYHLANNMANTNYAPTFGGKLVMNSTGNSDRENDPKPNNLTVSTFGVNCQFHVKGIWSELNDLEIITSNVLGDLA